MKNITFTVLFIAALGTGAAAQTKTDSAKLKADLDAIRSGKNVKTNTTKSIMKADSTHSAVIDSDALRAKPESPVLPRPNNPNPYSPRPNTVNPNAPSTPPASPKVPPGSKKGPGK